ncbi:hypothetical protein [Dokdonella sp.]|uniref:hypothetical protein n=1 Tax=Dokdonella sp. TaxID=2291710 RepID=UPI0031CAB85E|nr:hypothetical protein [Dokdonella sp.]
MKLTASLLAPLAALGLCATAASAQDTQTTVIPRANGELIVHWGQPAPRNFGPPPTFAQLAQGQPYISVAAAAAYPPLANDFIHADSNRDGRISPREYARWVAQP